jgi:hypothetical protein
MKSKPQIDEGNDVAKPFEPIDVRLDEVLLSLAGYEITDARARLVREYDEWEKIHKHELHLSIRGRFTPDEWTDRFTTDWAPELVPLVRASSVAPDDVTYYLPRLDHDERAVRISDRHELWVLKKPLPEGSVSVQLTTRDAANVDYDPVPLGKISREIPVQLLAEPASCGCRPLVDEYRAFLDKKPDKSEEPELQVHASGSFELCGMDESLAEYRERSTDRHDRDYRYYEEHPLPTMALEVTDDSGFILDEDDSVIALAAQVDRIDGPPMRAPRWTFTRRLRAEDYTTPPAQVVLRFERPGG